MEKIIKELLKQLKATGHALFSKDGLNIVADCSDGCVTINSSCSSNLKDKDREKESKEVSEFKKYIDSLNDDFFIKIAESLGNEKLHYIQTLLDSNIKDDHYTGIALFMGCAKKEAQNQISKIDKDLKEIEKALDDLLEIRDSYIHVLNKKF